MRRSKKGMALASTLILMTIVLMLSVLMMTLMLYSSQVTAIRTQNIDDRAVLDEIGQRFLKDKDNYADFLAYYVTEYEMTYRGEDGDPSETPTRVIEGTVSGMKLVVAVSESSGQRIMTTNSRTTNKQLMRVTCTLHEDIKTGEITSELKSWNYGKNSD